MTTITPKLFAAAMLWLCPTGSMPNATALELGKSATRQQAIDPLLVIAVIYVESRCNASAKSATHDYGLAQIHVSASTNPELLGKEELLFDPARNLQIQLSMLAAWRAYHKRTRRCKRTQHHWVSHYNQGCRVRSLRYQRFVLRIVEELREFIKGRTVL